MYRKKTKIVATLGPATASKEILKQLMHCGVDVMRINFSHAEYEIVEERIRLIREINEEEGYTTAILADLQGPKIRIGKVDEGAVLEPGDVLTFDANPEQGNASRVYMNYEQFARDVKIGENILIDDGKLILEIVETDGKSTVKAKTIQGGPLKSKKGVNLPNTDISLPALTEKDVKDAIFAIGQKVDWLALSFVRCARDIQDLKDLIDEHSDYKIPIVSKIEKPEALVNIDEIMELTDGVMVARGDLGVETPFEAVPKTQKMLIDKAKMARKPIIVATQLMESMIESLTPTRAEVNDVANAVFDGADAVMLSGETSVGKYPVQVIQKMTKIIQTVEDDEHIKVPVHKPKIKNERYITNIVCYNAAKMVSQTDAKVISTLTYSGYTAFQISSHRPIADILVFTPNKRIINMLSLLWGVQAFYFDGGNSTDETVIQVNSIARDKGFVKKGEYVINLNAMPLSDRGGTNTVRLTTI